MNAFKLGDIVWNCMHRTGTVVSAKEWDQVWDKKAKTTSKDHSSNTMYVKYNETVYAHENEKDYFILIKSVCNHEFIELLTSSVCKYCGEPKI